MKKATLIKLLCLALVSLMLVPMIIACGETQDPATSDSTDASTGGSGAGEKVRIEFRLNNSAAVVVSGEKTFDVVKGSKLTSAMAPVVSLSGYTLKAWSFTANLSEPWDGSDRVVNSDLVLYAIWETAPAGGTTGSNQGGTTAGKVTITFALRGGEIIDGEATVQIDKGGKLTLAMTPEVERAGYTFKCWSYDRSGAEEWFEDEAITTDITLYAQWTEKGQGGTTDSSNPPSGDTTDSSNPSGDTTDSSNPPAGGGDQTTDTITIEYEVGQGGDFESLDDFEKEVPYGERFRDHPTPINSNPAMLFVGWYTDAGCTNPVSNSTKYTENVTLYACWFEQAECTDGSYNHDYGGWQDGTAADCTTAGTSVRYCNLCDNPQTKVGAAPLGHKFGTWSETFMAKERVCQRLGCGERESVSFKNITTSLLGNSPADQIDGNTENFYDVPFTNLINNKWDEGFGEYISPRGTGQAYIQFNFVEATAIDRVYFNGSGVTSINTFVLYEGDDEFTLVGIMGGVSEKEMTPFAETDATRKVVAVKFVEENPPQGTSYWREVAFVKVAEE